MNTPTNDDLRRKLADNLDETMKVVNRALQRRGLAKLQPVLQRIGRGQQLPHCKETARAPSDAEWKAILASPLEGAIGVSLALQWRYNFGRLFDMEAADECVED